MTQPTKAPQVESTFPCPPQESLARILIVDDDKVLSSMLSEQLDRKGYTTAAAHTLDHGLTLAREGGWDVILLDVQLPDGNGLEDLPKFTKTPSYPEVIIITGHGAADGAEKAVLGGAWSYIEKPHVIRDLPMHLTRALQYRKEKQRIKAVPVALLRGSIIGKSKAINHSLDQLATAAASHSNVLITGETGTGKELFAQALHENSERSHKPFVVVDCASLPDTLIESTLFGHVKGAFTGADRAQEGLIQHANGGTLFLDEVGELPLAIQKNFLRVLQERTFRPVGGSTELHSDFRLVAATNRNLSRMVQEGSFRCDLLFRLQSLNLTLPPLLERLDDIQGLLTHFLGKLCQRYSLETKGIAPDLIDALKQHSWPGNVRELYQVAEQVFAQNSNAPTLYAIHLPQKLRIHLARATVQGNQQSRNKETAALPTWKEFKQQSECQYVKTLMQLCEQNIPGACKISGLSRARVYQLLEKYTIQKCPQK